jgi:hypothetical protein
MVFLVLIVLLMSCLTIFAPTTVSAADTSPNEYSDRASRGQNLARQANITATPTSAGKLTPKTTPTATADSTRGTDILQLASNCYAQATSVVNDISTPLRDITPEVGSDVDPEDGGNKLNADPSSQTAYSNPVSEITDPGNPIPQAVPNTLPMPTPVLNFRGISFDTHPFGSTNIPSVPDTNGDSGLNFYVQSVNGAFQIFRKTDGTSDSGPFRVKTLWQGFGTNSPCATDSQIDPIVLYDSSADRWLISGLARDIDGSGLDLHTECIAISTSADPLGSYYRYAFKPTTRPGQTQEMDYSKFGVWTDGYYMSTNNSIYVNANGTPVVSGTAVPIGSSAVVYQRDAMLTGRTARSQVCDAPTPTATTHKWTSLLPADIDAASLNGAALPPEGRDIFFATIGNVEDVTRTDFDNFQLFKFHVDWNNPNNTTFSLYADLTNRLDFQPELCGITQGEYFCVPQPQVTGTPSAKLDSLGDRLMNRLVYRNLDGDERLLANHTIDLAQKEPRAGVRWLEIASPYATPAIRQEHTIAPSSDDAWRWLGSLAMDHDGNIALGYNVSNRPGSGTPTIFPSIRYTGRLATDPLIDDLPRNEVILATGEALLESSPGIGQPWGDYSMMAIDATNDCTFWYTNMYYQNPTSLKRWSTKIGKFKFESCSPYVCPIEFNCHF